MWWGSFDAGSSVLRRNPSAVRRTAFKLHPCAVRRRDEEEERRRRVDGGGGMGVEGKVAMSAVCLVWK